MGARSGFNAAARAAARAQRSAAAHARDGARRAALRAVRALDQRRDLFFFVARPLLEVARARGRALGIRFYQFSFLDVFGAMRAKLVPASRVEDIASGGAGFAPFADQPALHEAVGAGGLKTPYVDLRYDIK